MALWPGLLGRRVQRVDMPDPTLLCLTVGPPKEVLVVALDPKRRGIALMSERPRGEAASAFVQLLRKWVAGGRIRGADQLGPGVLRLCVERREGSRELVLEMFGRGNVLLLADGELRGALDVRSARERMTPTGYSMPEDARGVAVPATVGDLRARADALRIDRTNERLEQIRRTLERALERHDRRLVRRQAAIEADRARVQNVEPLRAKANLLLSHLHAYTPGSATLEVTDWAKDPPETASIPINPTHGPKAEAEALFRRARKLERGAIIAEERLAATTVERAAIADLRGALEDAAEVEVLGSIAERASRAGVAGARAIVDLAHGRTAPRKRREDRRRPHRTFISEDGHRLLVGRGAEDNDRLTTSARPGDLWLHARGRRGAHVIVPLDKRESCPSEVLVDAATLAAHFSEAAGEPVVEVQYSPRRHVRKPRGTPPGTVLVDREKVLVLRVEPDRLQRLLAAEERE